MSMITEQVKRLRSEAAGMILQNGTTARLLREAAETIERAVICGAQEPCPNAISRSDMLDAIGHGTTYTSEDLQKIIKALPPVNPQPKTGHWIFDEILDKHYYCSECKSMGVDYWDFCPNCGCRMVDPQESEG